jgi:hypothetical protein
VFALSLKKVELVWGYMDYAGMQWFSFFINDTFFWLMLLLIVIITIINWFLLSVGENGIADFWFYFILITYLIPNIIYSAATQRIDFLNYIFSMLFLLNFAMSLYIFKKVRFAAFAKVLSPNFIIIASYTIVFVTLFALIAKYGLPKVISIFDSNAVSVQRSTLVAFPTWLSYSYNASIGVFIPILLCLKKNRDLYRKIILCLVLILFGLYGANRGPILIGIVFALFILTKNFWSRMNYKQLILFIFIVVLFIVIIAYLYLETNKNTLGLLYWRALVIPSGVTEIWVKYFSENNLKRGISDISVLKNFSQSANYPVYFKQIYNLGNLNAGVIAEAYSRYGIFGSIVMGCSLGFILCYLEFLLRGIKKITTSLLLSSSLVYLVNVELTVVLLTKGLIYMFILLILSDISKITE